MHKRGKNHGPRGILRLLPSHNPVFPGLFTPANTIILLYTPGKHFFLAVYHGTTLPGLHSMYVKYNNPPFFRVT
jgi:hypothetical protein